MHAHPVKLYLLTDIPTLPTYRSTCLSALSAYLPIQLPLPTCLPTYLAIYLAI